MTMTMPETVLPVGTGEEAAPTQRRWYQRINKKLLALIVIAL